MLACASLMTLDASGGDSSPWTRCAARSARCSARPRRRPPPRSARSPASRGWFRSRDGCDDEIAALEAENAELRAQVRTAGYDRNRLAELEGLTTAAADLGYALVPARVVGIGPGAVVLPHRHHRRRVRGGAGPDMTVVNNDGLVGRVLRVTRTTATVLLVVDADSTVGGRVGRAWRWASSAGAARSASDGRLDLELVDEAEVPRQGRHRGHLGQRRRRPVRLRHPGRARSPRSTPACARPRSAR